MSNLIMMVGNIGSGKSTLVKKLVKQGYLVVSRDALRLMVGGGEYRFDYDLEPEIYRIEKYALELLTSFNYDIIIDETNMRRFIRKVYLDIAKCQDYTTTAIIMPRLSKAESIKRRMKNNHGKTTISIWREVWDKFNQVYEKPTLEEGFNRVIEYAEGANVNETLEN